MHDGGGESLTKATCRRGLDFHFLIHIYMYANLVEVMHRLLYSAAHQTGDDIINVVYGKIISCPIYHKWNYTFTEC